MKYWTLRETGIAKTKATKLVVLLRLTDLIVLSFIMASVIVVINCSQSCWLSFNL